MTGNGLKITCTKKKIAQASLAAFHNVSLQSFMF